MVPRRAEMCSSRGCRKQRWDGGKFGGRPLPFPPPPSPMDYHYPGHMRMLVSNPAQKLKMHTEPRRDLTARDTWQDCSGIWAATPPAKDEVWLYISIKVYKQPVAVSKYSPAIRSLVPWGEHEFLWSPHIFCSSDVAFVLDSVQTILSLASNHEHRLRRYGSTHQ